VSTLTQHGAPGEAVVWVEPSGTPAHVSPLSADAEGVTPCPDDAPRKTTAANAQTSNSLLAVVAAVMTAI
jgi:hypothetical protein